MATLDEFKTAFQEMDVATTQIGDRITELMDQIKAGGMTTEQEAEVYAEVQRITESLKAMGKDPNNPVPE